MPVHLKYIVRLTTLLCIRWYDFNIIYDIIKHRLKRPETFFAESREKKTKKTVLFCFLVTKIIVTNIFFPASICIKHFMTDPVINNHILIHMEWQRLYTPKRRIDKHEMVQGILQRMPREIPKRMLRWIPQEMSQDVEMSWGMSPRILRWLVRGVS